MDLTACEITLSYTGYPSGTTSYSYEGRPIEPTVAVKRTDGTVLSADRDYTLLYEDNENAGTAHAVVRGMGDYAGERIVDF